MGAERATLVGCSQGGRIAINYALTYPARVGRLVLVASAISGAPRDIADDIQQLLDAIDAAENANDTARVNALEAHAWLDGPREREGRVEGAARKLFLDMNGVALAAADPGAQIDRAPDAYARLAAITQPTLVIAGLRDFPHVTANARHLAASLPNARLLEMDTAHLPSLEAPAQFNAALAAFLRETE